MDRRTLLAVILSVIVITIGFSIQNLLLPEPEAPVQSEQQREFQTTEPVESEPEEPAIETADVAPEGAVLPVPRDDLVPRDHVYQNSLIRVTFDAQGGSISSFQLLEHQDGNEPVEMVFAGESERDAFSVHFGGYDNRPIDAVFQLRPTMDQNVVEYYRDFYVVGQEEEPFTLIKRFIFRPDEYMFQLEITIENSVNEYVPLNFRGYAYTVGFEPQIGPTFEDLDQRNEWRRFQIFTDKARNQNLGREGVKVVDERVRWAAISGKYFSVIGVPDATDYDIVFASQSAEGVPQGSQMYFSRPIIRSSRNTDRFRFFVGPKIPTVLRRYDDAEDNAFGTNNLELTGVLETRFLLGWLENILKFILQLIVRVIPNYGIAIIILTILVKAALWPLTHKSYQSTAKMQSLAPKIQEIKEKYADNPNKVNQETAALYKKEGVNPLGGCLPMLLQFPFFIAMFGLFNNHFDLRGATFIPGWIDDLSSPESILNFGDFTLPLLGWTDLRLLPIIFVGTQLITSKITQTPSSGSNSQMKLMTYALPIVFFFILYNMPSGLLVYWIFSNVLTAGQQYYNNRMKQTRAAT